MYLVEAVSYQCSNGINPIIHGKRDYIFKELWNNGGKENFLSRLENIEPDIVINSCTGGINNIDGGTEPLNKLVDDLLRNKYQDNIKLFITSHPSSYWFWKKGLIAR